MFHALMIRWVGFLIPFSWLPLKHVTVIASDRYDSIFGPEGALLAGGVPPIPSHVPNDTVPQYLLSTAKFQAYLRERSTICMLATEKRQFAAIIQKTLLPPTQLGT